MIMRKDNGETNEEEFEAPLWVYLHGGGSGYYDEQGKYIAVGSQTEDTWNHEETYGNLTRTLFLRLTDKAGAQEDNTLSRRLNQGYRLLMVSMCDHDQYLGMGAPYPNNPRGPDAQVNGLQASMAAIDYTAANFPTSQVFVHGTSAGSVGAYAVGMSYMAEGVNLTAIVCDSVLGIRGKMIIDELAGTPGFPQQEGYDPVEVDAKIGAWRNPTNELDPESRIAEGFDAPPVLQIGGLADPQCAGDREPIPEAASDGFSNNCLWMAQPIIDLIAAQPGSPHMVAQLPGEGHVPTVNAGGANDIVDSFLEGVMARNPVFPFAGTNPDLRTESPTAPYSAAPYSAHPLPSLLLLPLLVACGY
jgi:hypothetical protein